MQLSADEYKVLSKLLDTALDLPAASVSVWLAQLDTQYEPYKATLRALLESRARAETTNFLQGLPTFKDEPRHSPGPARHSDFIEGATVGPYSLMRELGRGGMAVVWLAKRSDGSIARDIALKLPFAEVIGRRFAERFARERDILASLSHAHIARLYDAGVTESAQPYLAMEFIEGLPITAYCDVKRLTIAQRITLFLQVIDAVQHAHSQFVLHRDLKPSNILVTAVGQVVLLDFGVAKLLVEGEAHETEITHLGGRAMTPAYASPEQLSGNPLGTASDVYSLGVILHELLTGERPYRPKRNTRTALEEAILEVDAVAPSAAVGDPDKARDRSTTPKRLARSLKGDLDTIALKALKKNADSRYHRADALGEDLERYQQGKPVLARPDSASYQLKKFVSRHRMGVSAVSAAVVALSAFVAVSLWQARVAQVQAALAIHEARKSKAVQEFLLDLFRTNTDAQADPISARQMTARQMLDVGALRVEGPIAEVPEVQEAIQDTLAEMYAALGLDREAGQIMAARVGSLAKAYGAEDLRVAEAKLTYAMNIYMTDGYASAAPLLREAQQILDHAPDRSAPLLGQTLISAARLQLYTAPVAARSAADKAVDFYHRYPSDDDWLVTAYMNAGRARYALGDYAGAESKYRSSIAELEKLTTPPLSTALTGLLGLADAEFRLGKIGDAERDLRLALAQSLARNGEMHVDTIQVETRLGALLHATSRRAEGRRLLFAAVEKMQTNKSLNSANLALPVYRNWGVSLLADGRLELATEVLEKDVALRRRQYPGSTLLAVALRDLGILQATLGRQKDANATLEEGFLTWRTAMANQAEPDAANSFRLAQIELRLAGGDAGEALLALLDVAEPAVRNRVPLALDQAAASIARSRALRMSGQFADAVRAAQSAVDLMQQARERAYYQSLEADALLQLGQAQRMAGQPRLARRALEQSLALHIANDDVVSPWLAEVRMALAECFIDLGDRVIAGRLRAQAAAGLAAHPEIGDRFSLALAALSARLAS
jgi:serine/threonine protein kinase